MRSSRTKRGRSESEGGNLKLKTASASSVEMSNEEGGRKVKKLKAQNSVDVFKYENSPKPFVKLENGTSEIAGKYLINLFPEIWNLIFKYLSSTDLETLLNTCSHFYNLLSFERTSFLFPQVWKILSAKYGKNMEEFLSDEERKSRDAVQCMSCDRNQIQLLHDSEIQSLVCLKLRLVCKQWNITIDDYGKNYSKWWHPDKHYWTKCYFDVLGQKHLNDFIKHFESTHLTNGKKRSPFPGNTVILETNVENQPKAFTVEEWRFAQDEILLFFSKHGNHVKNLCVQDSIGMVAVTEAELYAKMKRLLETMPNLEILHHCTYFADDRIASECAEVGSFPRLEYLKCAEFGGISNFSYCIVKEFLRSNNHITKLLISEVELNRFDFLLLPLPNLTEFILFVFDGEEVMPVLEDKRVNWKLTKLKLEIVEYGVSETTKMSRILSLIKNKWGETLTDLVVEFPPPAMNKNCDAPISLSFKRLQNLELQFKDFVNLDFILPLRATLQTLSVYMIYDYEEPEFDLPPESLTVEIERATMVEKEIKLFSCIPKPHSTNIWTLFPNLKRLQHSTLYSPLTSYSRADHEAAVRRGF